MSKSAGPVHRRASPPDLPPRPASNDRLAAKSSNAGTYETDEKGRGSVHWLADVLRPAPRDGRACFPDRRWVDSPFVLVERRKGPRWKYGSIVICAVLWIYVLWLYHR